MRFHCCGLQSLYVQYQAIRTHLFRALRLSQFGKVASLVKIWNSKQRVYGSRAYCLRPAPLGLGRADTLVFEAQQSRCEMKFVAIGLGKMYGPVL